MKALSVANPWAWGIIHGSKRIENRSWRTNHRGTLLIHASKSTRFLHDAYPGIELPDSDAFVFGALIGTVKVLDCVPLAEVSADPFASGPWCWILSEPAAFEPIPWKGQTQLFHVPDSVLHLPPAAQAARQLLLPK